jgi:hypothetical protein
MGGKNGIEIGRGCSACVSVCEVRVEHRYLIIGDTPAAAPQTPDSTLTFALIWCGTAPTPAWQLTH